MANLRINLFVLFLNVVFAFEISTTVGIKALPTLQITPASNNNNSFLEVFCNINRSRNEHDEVKGSKNFIQSRSFYQICSFMLTVSRCNVLVEVSSSGPAIDINRNVYIEQIGDLSDGAERYMMIKGPQKLCTFALYHTESLFKL